MKIIMTCRSNYTNISGYINAFNTKLTLNYICPLNKELIESYIKQFLVVVAKLKEYDINIEKFDSLRDYQDKFKQYPILAELS